MNINGACASLSASVGADSECSVQCRLLQTFIALEEHTVLNSANLVYLKQTSSEVCTNFELISSEACILHLPFDVNWV